MAYLHRLQEHAFQMIWDKSEVILGTWGTCCKHNAKYIVNNKIPSPPPNFPKRKKNGIKVKCYWKHLGNLKNILGIHWEHNGNTL
jgi:hypothetical protein